jgi:hypothetical protein
MSQIDRSREIGKIITDAMRSAEGVDWAKDSPEITAAQAELDEVMEQYVEEATSKANVRTVYQRWRDLHKTGGPSV